MERLWKAWADYCAQEVDPRPMALVRIFIPMVVLIDLLRGLQLGLVPYMFRPWDADGINIHPGTFYLLDKVLPAADAGYIGFGVVVACMFLGMIGLWHRPAFIVGALVYAQLGCLYTPGDRGIDRLMRVVMVMLALSRAGDVWAVGKPRAAWAKKIPAWPENFVRYQVVLVYLGAGVGKVMATTQWLSWHGAPALYRIFGDPLSAHLDAVWLQGWFPVLRLMSNATILLELGSVCLVLAPRKVAPVWSLFGIFMHLGIFYAMDLGMFSWGMLAMYPLFLAPWIVPALDRWTGK